MGKKNNFELQVEQAFEKEETKEKAETLMSNYITAIYRKKKYFQSLRKSAIGGFIVGVILSLLPALSLWLLGENITISAENIFFMVYVIAIVTLFSVALIPIANQTNFTGTVELLIGYTIIICLLPLLAIGAPFYFPANVALKRKALIKDAQKHPELYEDIPLD